jgi:magnesium transporter
MNDGTEHRPETAGRHLVSRVPVAASGDSVASVLVSLAGRQYDAAGAVYVLGPSGRLDGVVPLPRLLTSPGDHTVGEIMVPAPPSAEPGYDQERVAMLALRHGLDSVPVADGAGRFLGVVPGPALLRILWREHTEDLHRLAGVLREGEQAHAAVEAAPWRRLARRMPWLLVGLAGSVVATAVMTRFERVLETRLAVAYFIPGIVYLSDAVGTQTEAVVVRYLAVGHAPLGRLLRGELLTGLLIGLSLSALTFPLTLLAFGDVRLAAAVTAAVIAAGLAASCLGLVFPWLLSRAGKDPAFGSGPVATIVQDVLSLLIYFGAVVLFLA